MSSVISLIIKINIVSRIIRTKIVILTIKISLINILHLTVRNRMMSPPPTAHVHHRRWKKRVRKV